jgi:hypothetical protein
MGALLLILETCEEFFGRIFFMLGRCQERDKGKRIPLDIVEYFVSVGAKIDEPYLLINNSALLKQ